MQNLVYILLNSYDCDRIWSATKHIINTDCEVIRGMQFSRHYCRALREPLHEILGNRQTLFEKQIVIWIISSDNRNFLRTKLERAISLIYLGIGTPWNTIEHSNECIKKWSLMAAQHHRKHSDYHPSLNN